MIMRQFIFTEAEKELVKNMTEKEHAAWWRDLKAKGDLRTYVHTYTTQYVSVLPLTLKADS